MTAMIHLRQRQSSSCCQRCAGRQSPPTSALGNRRTRSSMPMCHRQSTLMGSSTLSFPALEPDQAVLVTRELCTDDRDRSTRSQLLKMTLFDYQSKLTNIVAKLNRSNLCIFRKPKRPD